MNSIFNPTIAEKYFPETIFHYTTRIKTAFDESESALKAYITSFFKFNQSHVITFVLLIGLNDLRKIILNNDQTNNELCNKTVRIALRYEINRNISR